MRWAEHVAGRVYGAELDIVFAHVHDRDCACRTGCEATAQAGETDVRASVPSRRECSGYKYSITPSFEVLASSFLAFFASQTATVRHCITFGICSRARPGT